MKKTGENRFRRIRKDETLGEEIVFEMGPDGEGDALPPAQQRLAARERGRALEDRGRDETVAARGDDGRQADRVRGSRSRGERLLPLVAPHDRPADERPDHAARDHVRSPVRPVVRAWSPTQLASV